MQTVQEFVDALNAKFNVGEQPYFFELMPGRKYHRIVFTFSEQRSSFCFVDNELNVYKCEGWKKPAKGVRANIATLDMNKVDKFGSWLYIR
jgi:hypothetical protein